MTEKPFTRRVVCRHCNGTGEKININIGMAVLSLGMSAIINAAIPDECRICDGRGYTVESTPQ